MISYEIIPDYFPNVCPLELYTDAFAQGVGACLMQCQDGTSRQIAFAFMAFTSAQQNYSTLECELAAICWAVKSFRPLLFGVDFVVHTDHQPLIYLHNMKIVNSRLARTWKILLIFHLLSDTLQDRKTLLLMLCPDFMSLLPFQMCR